MANARIEHVYDCSEDTFWNRLIFDEEYNRRLFREALGFPQHELVKSEDTDTHLKRVVQVTPKLSEMPGPIKKLIGDSLSYREEGSFDKKARRYSLTIIPSKLADKMTVTGVIRTESLGDKKCRRIFETTVKCDIFGVGGMVEKRLIGDMEASYAAAARFTNQFVVEKGY
jgi:hypothetical protein